MSAPRALLRIDATDTVPLELLVNGTPVTTAVPARMTLADLLREQLGLTGTHLGCEHGVCGMCTVLVDGESVRSCLMFACQADGASIVTVEGLGTPDDLHPLQEAYGRHHALQCGFCTPGFLMSSYDLLSHNRTVPHEDLPAELSGVLCRCTGYRNIIDAVEDVATSGAPLPEPKNCATRTLLGRSSPQSTLSASRPMSSAPKSPQKRPDQIRLPQGKPTVDVEVTGSLSASLSEVGTVFADLRRIISCLPGVTLTEDLGDDWYAGTARVAMGPIHLKFQGFAEVTVHEVDRLHVLAQGQDTGSGGAQADITLRATPGATGTELEASARIYLTGRVAGFGRSLADDVSRRMFEQFAVNVDRAAHGHTVETDNKPASALQFLMKALRRRMKRWFTSLRASRPPKQ